MRLPGVKRRQRVKQARENIRKQPGVVVMRTTHYLNRLVETGVDFPLSLDGIPYALSKSNQSLTRGAQREITVSSIRTPDVISGADPSLDIVCVLPISRDVYASETSKDFILKYGPEILRQVKLFIESDEYLTEKKLRDEKIERDLTAYRGQKSHRTHDGAHRSQRA